MNYIVKDLMVPISEYITVSVGAALFDAVLALEEAQLYFDGSKKYQHRAVLIMDKNNRVVGKLSQLNVLRALGVEDDEKEIDNIKQLNQFGFSPQFVSQMEAQTRYKDRTLKDICGSPGQ